MKSSGPSLSALRSTRHSYFNKVSGRMDQRERNVTHPDKAGVSRQGLQLVMCSTAGPVTSVVNLNPSPFRHLAWDIFSRGVGRYPLVCRVWAAPRDNQVNELSLESGVDGKCTFQVWKCVPGICQRYCWHADQESNWSNLQSINVAFEVRPCFGLRESLFVSPYLIFIILSWVVSRIRLSMLARACFLLLTALRLTQPQ